jgi:hypothetical protein
VHAKAYSRVIADDETSGILTPHAVANGISSKESGSPFWSPDFDQGAATCFFRSPFLVPDSSHSKGKIAPGRYGLTVGVTDATLPIREGEALPRWARVLVTSAMHKSAVRWSAEPFKTEDLIALWNEGEGTLHVDQPAVPGNSSRRGQSAPSICAVA